MIRIYKIATFLIVLFFLTSIKTFAQSNYVLPYPSAMPGSFSYKTHLIYENISKFWYFGDFGQFDYNLKLADKYLVEAKILFEYKQYLLGHKALKKSDQYFVNILPNLKKAEKNGKSILQKETVFREESRKHIEVLGEIEKNTPGTFIWQAEKTTPTALNLKKAIDESIHLREKSL